MKKLSSVLIALMLSFTLILPVFAYEYWSEDVTVHASYGTPTIDGTVTGSEWDSATTISTTLNGDPIAEQGWMIYQGAWESNREDSDFSATYKLMWDEEFLYVLEARKDNVVNLAGNGTEPWLTDGSLIFLQAGDDGEGSASVNPDGYSHHIFYSVGNGENQIGGDLMQRICDTAAASRETTEAEGSKIASSLTDTGFIVEVAFPWSLLTQELTDAYSGPKAGDKLGFSMVIHDSDATDGTTAFEKQFCWAYFTDKIPSAGYDFGGWGVMVLDAAPETPNPDPDPTPPTDKTPTEPAPPTADTLSITLLGALIATTGVYITTRKKKY